MVAATVARALDVRDEPGWSPLELVIRHLESEPALLLFDNCEHVVAECAVVIESVLTSCPAVRVLATSREPVGVGGETTWRVPSLSLANADPGASEGGLALPDAVALFVDRARRADPAFELTDTSEAVAHEVCRRLDGIPLAIELAAARLRTLSLQEVAVALQDRFRLLGSGPRWAVSRQRTLRASVEWSHQLLSDAERVVLRRLSIFPGSFDAAAAEGVVPDVHAQWPAVADQLALLVDKSLLSRVVHEGTSRYRMLETVRHYARERLEESGEAAALGERHRDYYVVFAEAEPAGMTTGSRVDTLGGDIDNLRQAFEWSHQHGDGLAMMRLASSLLAVWMYGGRQAEGHDWLQAALAIGASDPGVTARALAASAHIEAAGFGFNMVSHAIDAVAAARTVGDDRLLAKVLATASHATCLFVLDGSMDLPQEAIEAARAVGDQRSLAEGLATRGVAAAMAGRPVSALCAFDEASAVAAECGHDLVTRYCRLWRAVATMLAGEVRTAIPSFVEIERDAAEQHDSTQLMIALTFHAYGSSLAGHHEDAQELIATLATFASENGTTFATIGADLVRGVSALASGDVPDACAAFDRAHAYFEFVPAAAQLLLPGCIDCELYAGHLDVALRRADDAIARTRGVGGAAHAAALLGAARAYRRTDRFDQAVSRAFDALGMQHQAAHQSGLVDTLEFLAQTFAESERYEDAARLLGAASTVREGAGLVRFGVHQPNHEQCVVAVRTQLGHRFEERWGEGTRAPLDDIVALALRGRGRRARPATGWASLTSTELAVAQVAAEGFTNKQAAARLFISPRTVQTHLSHVYAKLGIKSRSELAKEFLARPQ
jgi:predicted ATPase/DNA-binding CsgD family transcriptional regulator